MDKWILLVLVVVFPLAQDFELYEDFNASLGRLRRQIQQEPQLQPILNPPIPTSVGHYLGTDQYIDACVRDEVLVQGGCHRLLTRGPCAKDEYVLIDPANLKGYCAPRLCAPDRLFVFSDQMCHDPQNTRLCPPGRHLYQTAYGTPVCQCPDGTYEGDDDLDDDVCDPLLGRTLSCPLNQVLWWSKDFRFPPECTPDPCGGQNLKRGPADLPFVPSATDGKCYQLGQKPAVCPAQTWYSLALETLRGVCEDVEEAGYVVFDEETLAFLIQMYGPPIQGEGTASISPRPADSQIPGAPVAPGMGQGFPGQVTGQGVFGQVGAGNPGFVGQPGTSGQGTTTIFGQPGTSGQGFMGQPGIDGQGFMGQTGTSGQGFMGQPGMNGQGFVGQSGTTGQGFMGQGGTNGQGFMGQTGTNNQGFIGQPGTSGQGFTTTGQTGTSSIGQTFGGQGQGFGVQTSTTSVGQTRVPGQEFRGQPGITTTGPPGTASAGQVFTGTTQGFTPQGFAGQGFAGQGFNGQGGFVGQGFVGQGFNSQGFAGQTFPGQTFFQQAFPGQPFPGQGFAGQNVFGQRAPNSTFQSPHGQLGSTGQVFTGQVGTTTNGQTTTGHTHTVTTGQSPAVTHGQGGLSPTGQIGTTTTTTYGQTTTTMHGQGRGTTSGQTHSISTGQGATLATRTPQGPGAPRGGSHRGHPAHITSRSHHQQPSLGPSTSPSVTQLQPFHHHIPSTQTFPGFTHSQPTAHSHPNFHNPNMGQASPVLSPRMPMSPHGAFMPGVFLSHEQQSLEMFGMRDFMNPQLGRSMGAHRDFSPNPVTQGDLSVVMGQLLTHRRNLNRNADLSFLQTSQTHPHHGFFNGVKTLMAGVLEEPANQQQKQQQQQQQPQQQQQQQPQVQQSQLPPPPQQQQIFRHHRARRSPLPHSTPGNVFETRLVGCRAGAQRDINAKCRNTILPATAPAKRNNRAVPPVPPRPGCPTGKVYDRTRRCAPINDAVNSINAFNLGK